VDERNFQERAENVTRASAVADRQYRQRNGFPPTETRNLLPSVSAARPIFKWHPPTKGDYTFSFIVFFVIVDRVLIAQ